VHATLDAIATRFGCRVSDGIAERVIFRSLFSSGLTVFDPLDSEGGGEHASVSHVAARQEYRNRVGALNLPIIQRAAEPMRLSA
jgi:chromosome partitioning protein